MEVGRSFIFATGFAKAGNAKLGDIASFHPTGRTGKV